jgi:hypothetical protein
MTNASQVSTQANRSMKDTSRRMARWLVMFIEPLWLTAMVVAYWHHSPPIRDEWVWMVTAFVPITALRWWGWGRLWTPLALHLVSLAFIALSLWNFEQAPYARNDYGVLMVRPLLGMWLVIYAVELVRQTRSYLPLIGVSIVGGGIIAVLGLTATQFTVKSEALMGIITRLPDINYRATLPDMLLGFNVNEMGGILSWVVPLLLGVALIPFPETSQTQRHWWQVARVLAGIVGSIALLALMLGQSRFAIGGVLGSLLLLALFALRSRKRIIVTTLVVILIAFEAMIFFDVGLSPAPDTNTSNPSANSATLVSDRDQSTFNQRLEIWQRSLMMIGDYPLTGVGMSMFYLAVRYEPYIVTLLADRPPPHAHNEWLQIGTDLGIGGIVLFALWHGIALWYLWRIWRTSDVHLRHLAWVLLASLLAHNVFGMGDAIKLWDRYAFAWWWILGCVGALVVFADIIKNQHNKTHI